MALIPESVRGAPRRAGAKAEVAPELLRAGVYSGRRLRPLAEEVHLALGAPPREEVRGGLDLTPIWTRPRLHARIVEALADGARRAGADRIVAADAPSLVVASPVALRLGLPLDRRRGRGGATGRAGVVEDGGAGACEPPVRGRRPYLLACVLHDSEAPGIAGDGEVNASVGAGALVRIRGTDANGVDGVNILSIIEL